MNSITRYALEGFIDHRGEYDEGVCIVKPVIQIHDGNSLESVIENFCIDASLDATHEETNVDVRRRVQRVFYRARKKDTPSFSYWKCVVDVCLYTEDDEWIYIVREVAGACKIEVTP